MTKHEIAFSNLFMGAKKTGEETDVVALFTGGWHKYFHKQFRNRTSFGHTDPRDR